MAKRKISVENVIDKSQKRVAKSFNEMKSSDSHLPLKIMSSVNAKKRDEMLLKNMKARAKERLREGCSKPSDVLLMHLVEPCVVFEFLGLKEMECLRRDVEVFLDLDRGMPARMCYWKAVLVVCDWEICMARKTEGLMRERGLQEDVENILRGKSCGEIEELESRIELQARSGSVDVVEYWEPILECINICKAKAFLKEIHAKILCKNDQMATPELLYREEVGDNFEMKTVGVFMEEGDALSSANNEVILQSQVYKPKSCNRVATDSEGNNYNKTHYDLIMDYYGDDCEVTLQSQVVKPKSCTRVAADSEGNNYNKTHYDLIMDYYNGDD